MIWVSKVVLLMVVLVLGPTVCRGGRPGDWNASAVQNASLSQESAADLAKLGGDLALAEGQKGQGDGDRNESGSFNQGAVQGLSMILVSELGDETFIIAAIMAMRHPKGIIFAGAIGALALMTVISSALGIIVPALLSPQLTHNAATALYTIFGIRLLYVAWKAGSDETQEEIREVEQKLNDTTSKDASNMKKLMQQICTPVLLESFVLTFLAEWGDRSQIATITLAAHLNPVGVTIGAIVGHCICTGLAVSGGKLIAKKISQRTAALAGSVLFFVFALHNVL